MNSFRSYKSLRNDFIFVHILLLEDYEPSTLRKLQVIATLIDQF